MSKISEITPIKDGMTKDQAKNATKHFLQDIVTSQNMLRVKDIATQDSKDCGVRSYTLITMNDGSKWVPGSEGIERLIGAHYLKKNLAIEGWSVVETKCFLKNEQESKIVVKHKSAESKPLQNIITIQSADFISVSKYVGDKKP